MGFFNSGHRFPNGLVPFSLAWTLALCADHSLVASLAGDPGTRNAGLTESFMGLAAAAAKTFFRNSCACARKSTTEVAAATAAAAAAAAATAAAGDAWLPAERTSTGA